MEASLCYSNASASLPLMRLGEIFGESCATGALGGGRIVFDELLQAASAKVIKVKSIKAFSFMINLVILSKSLFILHRALEAEHVSVGII